MCNTQLIVCDSRAIVSVTVYTHREKRANVHLAYILVVLLGHLVMLSTTRGVIVGAYLQRGAERLARVGLGGTLLHLAWNRPKATKLG